MKINTPRGITLCLVALIGFTHCSFAQQPSKLIEDKDVRVLHYEDLPYPVFAQMNHTQGVVVLKLSLDENGKVVDATALSGAPILIQATIRNAEQWRFSPNSENAAIIVYNFRIGGTGCQRHSPYSQMTFEPPNFVTITNCKAPVWLP